MTKSSYHRTGDRRFLKELELKQFIENVESLRSQDITFTEIARRFGVGRQTITKRLKKFKTLKLLQSHILVP